MFMLVSIAAPEGHENTAQALAWVGCGVTWASPRVVEGRLEAGGTGERVADAARPSPGPEEGDERDERF